MYHSFPVAQPPSRQGWTRLPARVTLPAKRGRKAA